MIRVRVRRLPTHLICIPSRLTKGAEICILDQRYRIEMDEASRSGVRSEKEKMVLIIKGPNAAKRNAALRRWIARRVLEEATVITQALSQSLGTPIGRCSVRNYRSRLGACINRSRLVFHYGLAFLPSAHRLTIYAHEVAHLKHDGHQADFRATHLAMVPEGRHLEREARMLGRLLRI